MEIVVDVAHYFLIIVMISVAGVWVWLARLMRRSFTKTPLLDEFRDTSHTKSHVSVILPARNEEEYIRKCLDSLLDQDYAEYEIIAVDDSSTDKTGDIIAQYARKSPRVKHVRAEPKPDGWMGKNWACVQGYAKSTGPLLLFTDADTKHSRRAISLAVGHLVSSGLDALTASPRMLCQDFWTRVTLPVMSIFLHTRFSALRVNDPSSKTGYFFGSFFIMRREIYDAVGTHKAVRHEAIEDGALGSRVKEAGYKMKMVQGDHIIDAVWARDASSLWNAIKRLIVPLYMHGKLVAAGATTAVAFLLFLPFPVLAYSALYAVGSHAGPSSAILLFSSLAASLLVCACSAVEAGYMKIKIWYGGLASLGGFVMLLGFLSGMIHAGSDSAISWRDRDYSMKDYPRPSTSV